MLQAHQGILSSQNLIRVRDLVQSFLTNRRSEFGSPDPVISWRNVRGHVLLHALQNHPNMDDSDNWIATTLALGFNIPETRDEMEYFAQESGLVAFCELNPERVRRAILSDYARNWAHRVVFKRPGTEASVQMSSFAANLDLICPSLLDNDLRSIMLQHRAYRAVPMREDDFAQFSLEVRRQHAFTDANGRGMNFYNPDGRTLSLPWQQVRFSGERAEGDGLINEWFTEAARDITNPATGLLERQASGVYAIQSMNVRPQGLPQETVQLYFALGRYLALAVVHGRPVGFRLSPVVYGHILDQDPSLEDMASEEPELVRSLRLMLEAQQGELDNFPLEINGEEVEVTTNNRVELVGRKLRSLMDPRTNAPLGLIVAGFRTLLPLTETVGVTVGQLGDILYGTPAIDVEDLISSIELGPGLAASDNHIQWLFETLRSYSNQELSDFVRFALGTPIAPLGGFQSLSPRITVFVELNDRGFPRSKTCFRWIYLPRYVTKVLLQEKLNEALANNGAMHD